MAAAYHWHFGWRHGIFEQEGGNFGLALFGFSRQGRIFSARAGWRLELCVCCLAISCISTPSRVPFLSLLTCLLRWDMRRALRDNGRVGRTPSLPHFGAWQGVYLGWLSATCLQQENFKQGGLSLNLGRHSTRAGELDCTYLLTSSLLPYCTVSSQHNVPFLNLLPTSLPRTQAAYKDKFPVYAPFMLAPLCWASSFPGASLPW